MEAALDGVTVLSPKVRVQVTEAGGWGLLNETAEDYTKSSAPSVETPPPAVPCSRRSATSIFSGRRQGLRRWKLQLAGLPDKLDLPSGTFFH